MDKLWWFSDTNSMCRVPDGESIVDDQGMPTAAADSYRLDVASPADFVAYCETVNQLILISGRQLFKSDYLAAIPTNLPSLALIKANTSADARLQLEQLNLDGWLFNPFTAEALKVSIQKSYEDRKSILALQEELKNYSEIAFTAMSSASEMGIVAFYAQAVQEISSMDRLADQTIRCLNDLSVNGYLQFTFDDSVEIYPRAIAPGYRNLFDQFRMSALRIVSHGRFLIFNFENAQFLIIDAPIANPDKYGRLRDVIAQIASIAEARAKTIKVNSLLKVQQEKIRTVMSLLEMASRDNRSSVKLIMTELSQALRELAVGMDLTLEQESSMLKLSERALGSLETLHEVTDAIEGHFRSLVVQLDQAARLLDTKEQPEQIQAEASIEFF
ncbi:hypothetical protein GCM10011613_16450 [Cellvibrio zantedeschiae]|uniref:Uncharacterized protein n=1 Tax=Cellvibrio zantedeschiae TaxID=1237077 RepID=A0ABQ3B0I4_9GAMM|nr:hypothetical protein [Cellvibrio zantedeschiae]GGY72205.1 hypothetical protein GCM10011613_16450 [Cellvibrio zantedeschiae]